MAAVLITGASRGIGRAVAGELADRGHEVIATARSVDDLAGLDVARRLPLDVTDPASVQVAVAAAGAVDVLLSNAGRTVRAPMERVPVDELRDLFDLNAAGPVRLTQALLPGMRERGHGRLLFVSSILGRLTIPLVGPYAASKWALEAIAETLAVEVARFGIAVSILEPGPVASDIVATARRFTADDPVYGPLIEARTNARGATISVEEAATAIADVVDDPNAPFRVPIGAPAARALAGRKAHPDEIAFHVPGLDDLDW